MPSSRRALSIFPLKSLVAMRPLARARLALLAGAVFSASVLALAGAGLWVERTEELAHIQRDLVNLSHALAGYGAQRLETIDLALKATLDQLHDPNNAADASYNARVLRLHADALAAVVAIGIYGADGELLAGSTADAAVLPRSLAGAESLAAHRSGKLTGMHVSEPLRVAAKGSWCIVLSRRLSNGRGEFRGVIAAMFDPRALAESYRTIDLGIHANVALLGWNGTLVASYPWHDALIAQPFGMETPADDADSATTWPRLSPFHGRPVIAASSALRGYPLTLSLMADERSVLASWRRHALLGGSAAIMISVLALALALVLDRHLRRGEESLAELRENQAELTAAQRIARLGSWRIDAASGAIQWSAQAASLLGIAPALVPTLERLLERVLEEDRARVQRAWAGLLAAGHLDVEFRTTPVAGELRWLRARAEAPVAAEQSPFRARGTLVDITEERRAEQAVQHLAAVVESTEDAILSVAGDGRILSWNRGASRMFGYGAAEAIGRRLFDLLPPNEAVQATHLVARSAGGETIEGFETDLTAKGGRTIHIAVTLSPLRDASGRVTAASAVARDITARREAELRRSTEHRIAQLLAESAPLARTMPRILEALCQSLGLDCGLQWELRSDGQGYQRACLWCRPDLEEAASRLAAHAPPVEGCRLGAVWRSALPQWVGADALAPCRNGVCGLGATFASTLLIPITLGAKVVCVLELLSEKPPPLQDVELLAAARGIGSQIGQYMERQRAEDDLRAEKEYIGHVLASAPTLIASIAADGTTRSINPAIRDIADYTAEDLQGRNFWQMVHGGDAAELDHLLEAAGRGGVADHHLTIRTRGDELRDLSVSAAARRAPDGSVVEYILVGTDVTARRLDEARRATEYAVARALGEEQSEREALQRILGTVCTVLGWDCGVYRVFDPATRLVSCPYSWRKPTPELDALVQSLSTPHLLEAATMYWRTVDSRYPQWDNNLPARVGASLRQRAIDAGVCSALSIPVQAGERFLGALQFFGRSNHRPANVLIEAMQTIGHQVGQFIERKRVEAAQQQADERLRNIAANIPGIVFEYRLRADGTAAFDFVSERALDMLEEQPQSMMRDPRIMFRLVEPAYRRALLRSMRVSRQSRSLWLNEMPIRTRSGRVRWVRGQSMPKYLADGAVIWDGVVVDVTAQKQAEQAIQQLNEQLERRVAERTGQLSAANRELESFAYSVSHDLRAPLRSIDGFSRILMEEYGDSLQPTAADYLNRVRNASQRMGQLIDDLLSLSRVTRSELKRVRTDLSAIAEAIVQELRAESSERKVDVSIHPGMFCLADPSLIRIALYNLIGNAWKFTSKRATASIEFGALTQRNKTVYYVRDDGAGFDMGHAGKLFGAFQRLHSPREFEGTGVGLATVSRIVDRHGGTVWAESTLDKGATFYFTLAGGAARA
ncbi:MAG: PAS domain S-box protein [Burkholderiales bacterium]|nr:PAS domain S-box protein [Burkholderiales bacterium]